MRPRLTTTPLEAMKAKTEEPEEGPEETLEGSTKVDQDAADASEISPARENAEPDNKPNSHPASRAIQAAFRPRKMTSCP